MPQDQDSQLASHETKEPEEANGVPKFGKLLIVLAFAVAIVVALTYGSKAYYSS